MGANANCSAALPWDHGRTNPTSLVFSLTCWLFCQPTERPAVVDRLRKYLSNNIPHSSFKIEVDWANETKDSLLCNKESPDMVKSQFVGLKLLCTVVKAPVATEADCYACCTDLCSWLRKTLCVNTSSYRSAVGDENPIISWNVCPAWGWQKKMARFDLTSRYRGEMLDPSPVEQIGAIINRLTNIKAEGGWLGNQEHEKCGPGSVINCIQQLLKDVKDRRQKFDTLASMLKTAKDNGTLHAVMKSSIEDLVAMNQTAITINQLLEKNLGRNPSSWGFLRRLLRLCRLFTSRQLNQGDDSTAFKQAVKTANANGHHFRCVAQTVAAYIRLQQNEVMSSLQSAISKAPTHKEKTTLPARIGLDAMRMGSDKMMSDAFAKVMTRYTKDADEFISEVDEILMMHESRMFRTRKGDLRSKRALRRAQKKGWQACLVQEKHIAAKNAAADHEKEWDSDSDSDFDRGF